MKIENFGNIVLNNYVLKIDNIVIIIDTGYPQGYSKFVKKIELNDMKIMDVDYVFLTHAHDDHAGFINEVIDNSNAKLVMSKKAIDRLKMGHNSWIGGCSGLLAKLFVKGMGIFGKSKHEYPKYLLRDREVIFNGSRQPFIEAGIPLEIVELPGHTADSIGLKYGNEALFCGDAAMNGFPSIGNKIIWIEDKDAYIKTWDKMINMNVETVYPSHGTGFNRRKLLENKKSVRNIKIWKI